MADSDTAARLTAALLQSLPNAGFRTAASGPVDRVEIARHAVALYETILGMLQARPANPS
jgi:hypothetical protein